MTNHEKLLTLNVSGCLQELTRFISTAVTDKDLVKKCNACMDIIRVAKDKQAAEAAKNANNLLEELDREKNIEESKKAAAARKREKKKRRKAEKRGGPDGDAQSAEGESGTGGGKSGKSANGKDDDDDDADGTTEDEKEKTPEIEAPAKTTW